MTKSVIKNGTPLLLQKLIPQENRHCRHYACAQNLHTETLINELGDRIHVWRTVHWDKIVSQFKIAGNSLWQTTKVFINKQCIAPQPPTSRLYKHKMMSSTFRTRRLKPVLCI
ncbi:hypothetical protein PR048_017350 [Dryococelus australis]|uniref:Uncharacterized protein n=1 Tax=Dryococelus australis TaxID=614101 RepID=A0ABQ9H995_9NEOP|nr:hypothetical protein PR048_017350 [Dryococelus australis]